MSEEQILTDPNSPGWRYLRDNETVQAGDEFLSTECMWCPTNRVGEIAGPNVTYRRRIEQVEANPDDPSGPGWRDVEVGEVLQQTDMVRDMNSEWVRTGNAGWQVPPGLRGTYRRRIEPQQPSDSEPETIDSWEMRLAKMTQWNLELEALVAEAERSGEQVNAELQQLRGQLATSQHLAEMSRRQVADEAGKVEQLKTQLWDAVEARQKAERELKDANEAYQLCLQSHYKAGQRSAIDKLQAWLKPVLEVVAENPEDSVALALAVLADMPAIAARLIEE